MSRKKKKLLILICVIAAVLLLRFLWVHAPSEGMVIFENDATGVYIADPLTKEEVVAVKKILWGRVRWPEWLYGDPACGFGRIYGFNLDGIFYMMSWDRCGTLCVKEEDANASRYFYIDISNAQRSTLQKMFDSRKAR